MADDLVAAYVDQAMTFEELYELEYPALVAVATALTGSFEASEDLVQDTMVKAFLRWSWLSNFGRPGAWCHKVLTNACRSYWRRRRVESKHQSLSRGWGPSFEGVSDDCLSFWQAVRRLPSRPGSVVALYYAADRSIPEIASILGIPEGTVRSDLTRARVALAKELGMEP